MNTKRLITAVATLALGASVVSHAAIWSVAYQTIDEFDSFNLPDLVTSVVLDGSATTPAIPSRLYQEEAGLPSALGGYRTIDINVVGDLGDDTGQVPVSTVRSQRLVIGGTEFNPGYLAVAAGEGQWADTVLGWGDLSSDGTGDAGTPGPAAPAWNLDVSEYSGMTLFGVGLTFRGDGPDHDFTIGLKMTSSAAGVDYTDSFFVQEADIDNELLLGLSPVGPFDFSDVDGLELTFFGADSLDFSLDSVAIVPEPSALMLILLASPLAALRRRRR